MWRFYRKSLGKCCSQPILMLMVLLGAAILIVYIKKDNSINIFKYISNVESKIKTQFNADSTTSKSKKKRPNIVFVLADDYGFNDVGYHGSSIYTPNLDKLAAKGVKLENYYVQPMCTPTRSQLLSGRYQIHTGLQHNVIHHEQANGLPLDSPTLADKLREAGYATHCVGKWHLGFYSKPYIPINRGFDTFYGLYTGASDHFSHKSEHKPDFNDEIKDFYLALYDQDKPVFNEMNHYSTHLYTKKAIERINDHDKSKPLFLFLSYQAVHTPMQVPQNYLKKHYKNVPESPRRTYSGMVTVMDEGIGNVTRALKKAGMWDNTVFIFSSDNGGASIGGGNNYPLRGEKGSLFEGGIRAVGFVTGVQLKTDRTVNRALIHVSDWFPTLVNLAGGALNGTKDVNGFDQWKAISEGQPGPRFELLHDMDPWMTPWRTKPMEIYKDIFDTTIRASLRYGDWKILTGGVGDKDWRKPDGTVTKASRLRDYNVWLFNITADPYEQNDVSSQNPEVVGMLVKKLGGYDKASVPCRFPDKDPRSNPVLHGGVWKPWI